MERDVLKSAVNVRYLVLLSAAAALGGVLFGFDVAIITGAGPFLTEHFHLSALSLGWAFSSLLFGCVVGSFLAGRNADRYGRRGLLIWVAVLFLATSVASALAPNFSAFIVARFVGGIAVGAASLLCPMYVAEVSPQQFRGRMGTLYQMSIITGILISYCINYLLRNSGANNWRWMFFTGVVPSAIFFVLMLTAPETPRFLVMKGKVSEAESLLERLIGSEDGPVELASIVGATHQAPDVRAAMRRPGVRRAMYVAFVLAILIHVSGINTIVDYAPVIFQAAGWKLDAALASTFFVGVTEFVFTAVSFWVIDRYGRKPLYIVGSIGMAIALLVLLVAAATGHFYGSFVMVSILAYLAFFAACIGPVFWTLVAEIFPNDVRGTAMIVPVLTQWVANAVVVLFFPLAFLRAGKAITFGFLGLMALAQAIFTWIAVPETKNKSLEEIEAHWVANLEV
ncbi:MAG: sugar porter family MFS transporter [Acidobacteriota bacterium]